MDPATTIARSRHQLQDLARTAALSSAVPAHAVSSANLATAEAIEFPAGGALEAIGDDDAEEDQLTDARRNWSEDVTLKLVKIWKRVCQEYPGVGRVARMQMVYDEFKEAVDCSNRSRKAVEDKLYTVKQMYQFIVKMNGSFHKSQAAKSADETAAVARPAWFELTKDERRVVRSLHRIRIPNISYEVYLVLKSVLNPSLPGVNSQTPQARAHVSNSGPTYAAFSTNDNPVAATAIVRAESEAADVVDNKRNWSNEVTLQLAKAWRSAVSNSKDLRGALLSQRVYNEFMKVVGGCSRSRKAIEDKMHSMKEMYRFIRMYNASCAALPGKTPWFELTKPDRRQLRTAHKIRVPNLTPEVYKELDAFMSQASDVSDSFPEGFSKLLAAQQNLSMGMTPSASSSQPQNTVSTTATTGPLDAALVNTYDVLRRLAEEENQLSPAVLAPMGLSNSLQQNQPTLAQAPTPPRPHEEHDSTGPSAKRLRTAEPVGEQRLQELLALQQHAIIERRQQHAEQMALLLEIVDLLRQHTQ